MSFEKREVQYVRISITMSKIVAEAWRIRLTVATIAKVDLAQCSSLVARIRAYATAAAKVETIRVLEEAEQMQNPAVLQLSWKSMVRVFCRKQSRLPRSIKSAGCGIPLRMVAGLSRTAGCTANGSRRVGLWSVYNWPRSANETQC